MNEEKYDGKIRDCDYEPKSKDAWINPSTFVAIEIITFGPAGTRTFRVVSKKRPGAANFPYEAK